MVILVKVDMAKSAFQRPISPRVWEAKQICKTWWMTINTSSKSGPMCSMVEHQSLSETKSLSSASGGRSACAMSSICTTYASKRTGASCCTSTPRKGAFRLDLTPMRLSAMMGVVWQCGAYQLKGMTGIFSNLTLRSVLWLTRYNSEIDEEATDTDKLITNRELWLIDGDETRTTDSSSPPLLCGVPEILSIHVPTFPGGVLPGRRLSEHGCSY
jgi:hypothetical protein